MTLMSEGGMFVERWMKEGERNLNRFRLALFARIDLDFRAQVNLNVYFHSKNNY